MTSRPPNASGELITQSLRVFDGLPIEVKREFWYADNNYEVRLAHNVLRDKHYDIPETVRYIRSRLIKTRNANSIRAYGPDYPKIGGLI